MSAFGLIATALAPRADVSCHTSSRLLLTRSGHASPQTSWAVPYLQVFWSKPLMRHKQQLIAVLVQEKFNVLRSLAVKPIHKGDSENYKRRFRLQDFVWINAMNGRTSIFLPSPSYSSTLSPTCRVLWNPA